MRRRTVALLAVVGIWWLRRGGGDAPRRERPQAAVLGDRFAVLVGPRDVHDSRRVIEVERDGTARLPKALRVAGEVRLVGTPEGTAVAWREGKQVKLATLDRDGYPENASAWGKNAMQLCDGAATNEHRFAVGWLEADGRMWFVHGDHAELAAAGTAKQWCGVASAERKIAMLWREGGQLYMNLCAKSCDGRVVRVPVDRSDALLGFGCLSDRCLFATRDKRGATRLSAVTEKGRTIAMDLADAAADTAVSIVGAGERAFAISYMAKDGRATIQRVTAGGETTHTWHFEGADDAPALAWADERLLVVYESLQSEQTYVLGMPR